MRHRQVWRLLGTDMEMENSALVCEYLYLS